MLVTQADQWHKTLLTLSKEVVTCEVKIKKNNFGCSRACASGDVSFSSECTSEKGVYKWHTEPRVHCLWDFFFSFFIFVWWQWCVAVWTDYCFEPFWMHGRGQMVTFFFTCGVKEASLLLEDAYQICSQLTACFLWAKASHYASVGGCVSVVWDLVTTTSDLANGLHMNCICRTGRPLSLYTSQLSILLPIISGLADRSCVDNH